MTRPLSRCAGLTTALAFCLSAATGPLGAATDCATDAMLVFDGSGSMSEIGFDVQEETRIEEARRAVARAMPQIAPFRRVGLVTYGPGGTDSCSGINVHFGPRAGAAAAVVAGIDALRPGGLTPLSASVTAAAEVLSYRSEPGLVVLVTDGNETCGGRPCALGAELAANARDLTVHVIGFRVEVDFWTWNNPEQELYSNDRSVSRCLAERTGGMFVTTETVDELVEALQRTLGCPVIGALPGIARRDAS
ncbi:MAG: vWA domain-containing protein [Pseudooceanicola sp.]